MQNEIWKPVVGYEGLYEVSNLGNVKRIKHGVGTKTGILKPYKHKGYISYTLTSNGVQKDFLAHRLVCKAFLLNPLNKPCVNHKDSNRSNNNVENLEWCTYSENTKHAFSNNRFPVEKMIRKGVQNGRAKLTEIQVTEIQQSNKTTLCIAKDYNISKSTAWKVKTGYSWKHTRKKIFSCAMNH